MYIICIHALHFFRWETVSKLILYSHEVNCTEHLLSIKLSIWIQVLLFFLFAGDNGLMVRMNYALHQLVQLGSNKVPDNWNIYYQPHILHYHCLPPGLLYVPRAFGSLLD